MKIGIVGGGVVGSATAKAFSGFVDEVRVYDRLKERSTHDLISTLECDIIFVCLPTPHGIGSLACDETAVDSFFYNQVPDRFREANFVLRSTVPVGFTGEAAKNFKLPNLVHSPEFLTARTATFDAQNPTRNIIGHTRNVYEGSSWTENFLRKLYERRWPHVEVINLWSDESELVKLAQNAFSAVKIAFFNELRTYCDKSECDFQDVREALLAGGWIHPMHTKVPGPDGKYGFGGTCLVPTTPISTPSGWTPIEELEVGDSVSTHEGITKITGVSKREVPTLVTVRARGRAVSGSLDHIHVEIVKGVGIRKKLLGEFKPGDWIFLPWQSELVTEDVITLPPAIPYAKSWRDAVTWSKELAWAVGLWLAEGHRGIYKSGGRSGYTVGWTVGWHEEWMADRLVGILKDEGLNPFKSYRVSTGSEFGESHTWGVTVKVAWFYYLLETLGVSATCYHKRAPLACPYPEDLIGGWLDGDGSLSTGTVSGHSESTLMIQDLERLLSNLKVSAQISNDGKKLKISSRDDVERVCGWTQRLKFSTLNYARGVPIRSQTSWACKSGTAAQVQDVTFSSGGGVVAIETESGYYIANGHLTHNCLPKDLANLITCLETSGLSAPVMRAAYHRNELDRERK